MIYRFLVLVSLLGSIISCKGHESKENKVVSNATVSNERKLPEVWRWKSEDKSQEFTLKILKMTQDSLFAQYCAVYNNGQKLDCDFEENINIKAAFNKSQEAYIGNFQSFFNSGKGTCFIKINDNALIWTILKIPNGEYYAPNKCILKKEDSLPIKKEKELVDNRINLPFDYEKYKQVCIQSNTTDCQKKYPSLNKTEYNKVIKIIDSKEGAPESIFSIKPISQGNISIYLLNFEGDSSSQEIVTINNNKIISRQSIGYAMPEEDTYDSFVINPDMTIDIYKISFDNLNKKKSEKYKILANGTISKI
ncbi:hypothetical protein [Chryseobacterium aureum]|uniref:hypothetical protein n=1 Tax=Chryseobacterium aureum TaxID=2497456 RepID=UPI0013DE9ECA|nr:hypothetical protein [Chryseobacterium aureum]